MRSSFVGLIIGDSGKKSDRKSNCDEGSDVLALLAGLSKMTQSSGSVFLSSSSKSSWFLTLSSFNSESTKMTANFVLNCVILS